MSVHCLRSVSYTHLDVYKRQDQKMVALISENYRQIYLMHRRHTANEEDQLYLRLLLVTDFISGMTDTYAKDLYQKLNGIS